MAKLVEVPLLTAPRLTVRAGADADDGRRVVVQNPSSLSNALPVPPKKRKISPFMAGELATKNKGR